VWGGGGKKKNDACITIFVYRKLPPGHAFAR
jgi:hypothetical protein